jgi:hypothetical protein
MTGLKKMRRILVCGLMVLGGAVAVSALAFGQDAGSGTSSQSSGQARPAPLPDLMSSHGRLKIETPSAPLRLGEEARLVVSLVGPPVRYVSAAQHLTENGGGPCGGGERDQASFDRNADGSPSLRFVPQCLGKIRIHVAVIFSDGGMDYQDVPVEVIAGRSPETLKVGLNALPNGVLMMDLSERLRRSRLWLTATYTGVKQPQPVPAKDARFKVTMAKGDPVVRVDSETGWIDALRIGHALIEATYGGLSQTTCVVVMEHAEFTFSDRSNCEELRGSGETSTTVAEMAAAVYAQSRSQLPYTATDGRRGRFVADERVDAVTPNHALQIAENNAIAMKMRGAAAVARIECHTLKQMQCVGWTGDWSREGLPFDEHADGNTTVHVFPSELGHEEFTFFILFADGGAAVKKVAAEVEVGSVPPRAIGDECNTGPMGKPTLPVRLGLGSPNMSYEASDPMYVFACYDGIRDRVMPPGSLVKYTLHSEGAEPVVQVNAATGKVTGLRPGEALVEEEFAGRKDTRCVVVVPQERRWEPDLSNCRALRAKYGPALTEVNAHVNKPDVIQDAPMASAEEARVGRFGNLPQMGVPQVGRLGDLSAANAAAVPTLDPITAGTLSTNAKDWFAADGRVEIPLNGVVAVLGETTKIPIWIHVPEVLAMRNYSGTNTIFRNADGSLFVNMVAMTTGTAEFRISVLFSDGAVATKQVRIPVKLPSEPPVKLINALEGNRSGELTVPATTLHMLMTPPQNTRTLFPFVSFDARRQPFALSPQDVTFAVRNASGDPVVRLDSATGTLTALRGGHALVTTRFDGVASETCIVVMADATVGDPSNCEELRK